MAQHVILLTDAFEPPAAELTEALGEAGIAAFIEVLREIEVTAPAEPVQPRTAPGSEGAPAPLAILFEVVPGADMVEIYSAIEHATANWPSVPVVACRQPALPQQRVNLRVLESSTLRRLGFKAVADEPAQLPALLRELELRGQTGELRLSGIAKNPFLIGSSLLPSSLGAKQMRAAFELVASLHFASDQRSAAYTALEGIRQLIKADRWTIYIATEAGVPPQLNLEPLAVRSSRPEDHQLPDNDWRRILLNDALMASGPVSDAAKRSVESGETTFESGKDSRVIAVPLISGDRVMGVLEASREGVRAKSFSAIETGLLDALTSTIASALSNSIRIAEAERL